VTYFRRDKAFHKTIIQGQPIQSFHEYKYLGVVLEKLKWEQYTELSKKGQQRLYFLKKLISFVDCKMAEMFYTAYVESVLTFCIICWFGSAAEAQKSRLRKIVTTASC
jgi:hypothetical protein